MDVVDFYIIKLYYFRKVWKCKELDGTSQKGKCKEMDGTEGVYNYIIMTTKPLFFKCLK